MKDYLNEVFNKFPIRRKTVQKDEFFKYVENETKQYGYTTKVETLKNNKNIVIGDYEKAKIVFTAHYDTPATALIPNLMMPRNKGLSFAYAILYALVLVAVAMFLGIFIQRSLGLPSQFSTLIYLLIYFGEFYLTMFCFPNKNNKNDNTSGVATILSLVENNPNKDIAFILFDNEELGLLGSKALAKAKKEVFSNKLVINLDCVANGKEVLLIAKDKAEKLPEYEKLKEYVKTNENFNVHFYPLKGSMGNSDHKNFDCGVGVLVAHKGKGKLVKYCCGRIHTNRDTVANVENIEFLTNSLTDYVNNL